MDYLYIKNKIVIMRKKLSEKQGDILEVIYKDFDLTNPLIQKPLREAIVYEYVLDRWMELYKEEYNDFWNNSLKKI